MLPQNIVIRRDALNQFQKVYKENNKISPVLKNPEKTLRKILANATLVVSNDRQSENMPLYGFERYLFTVDENANTLVAVTTTNGQERTPPIDMDKIRFSNHAISRFINLYRPLNEEVAEETIRKLLARAKRENLHPKVKILRIINNGYAPAQYFTVDKWRFVIIEDNGLFTVVTFERDLFG